MLRTKKISYCYWMYVAFVIGVVSLISHNAVSAATTTNVGIATNVGIGPTTNVGISPYAFSRTVEVQGRKILYKGVPFSVKGVEIDTPLVGNTITQGFDQIRNMNANVIFIRHGNLPESALTTGTKYSTVTSNYSTGTSNYSTASVMRLNKSVCDAAGARGLKIIAGYTYNDKSGKGTIGEYDSRGVHRLNFDINLASVRASMVADFSAYVISVLACTKDSKNLFAFTIGYADMLGFKNDPNLLQNYRKLLYEMTQAAHRIAGPDYPPVMVVNADMYSLKEIAPNVDAAMIWADRGNAIRILPREIGNINIPLVLLTGAQAFVQEDPLNPNIGRLDEQGQAAQVGMAVHVVQANPNLMAGFVARKFLDHDAVNTSINPVAAIKGVLPRAITPMFSGQRPLQKTIAYPNYWGIVARLPGLTGETYVPRMAYTTLQQEFAKPAANPNLSCKQLEALGQKPPDMECEWHPSPNATYMSVTIGRKIMVGRLKPGTPPYFHAMWCMDFPNRATPVALQALASASYPGAKALVAAGTPCPDAQVVNVPVPPQESISRDLRDPDPPPAEPSFADSVNLTLTPPEPSTPPSDQGYTVDFNIHTTPFDERRWNDENLLLQEVARNWWRQRFYLMMQQRAFDRAMDDAQREHDGPGADHSNDTKYYPVFVLPF